MISTKLNIINTAEIQKSGIAALKDALEIIFAITVKVSPLQI